MSKETCPMKTTDPALEALKEYLTDLSSRVTGFRRDAFRVGAIEKMAQELASRVVSLEELSKDALCGPAELVSRLAEAVPVGETYFFREPEHFRYLEEKLFSSRPPGPLKVWSAGCATGEETYSIAACLLGCGYGAAEILGTDLSQGHLEIARKGNYHSWSLRDSGELYPAFGKTGGPLLEVRPELREGVRFLKHNLLEPLPEGEGPFDLIFCRNVLVYFTPEAARQVLSHMTQVLAPTGLLFLGPADLPFPPPGFNLHGPAELSIYEMASPAQTKAHPPVRLVPAPWPDPPRRKKTPAARKPKTKALPLALHLKVLEALENENGPEAGRQLNRLCQDFPEYLPGLYEAALWNFRSHKKAAAEGLMRELLKRLKGKGNKEIVPGPQPLTVHFYRVSARTFLARRAD